MNGSRRRVQRRTASFLLFVLALLVPGAPARGDDSSPAEIVAARELFRLGTEDADAGRFAEALEKFKRVAAVKETAAVRFNIARCEESLEKTGAALADFELAEREARQDPKGDEVAKLAHDRADALRPKVPRLMVGAPKPPPSGLAVSLDGGKLAVAALGAPLPLDPGAHVVEASAPGRSPFRADLTLGAGETKSVQIAMAPVDPSRADPPPGGEEPPTSSSQRIWGYISLGAGAAAGGAAIGFGLMHNSAVGQIATLCPNPQSCPSSKQGQVNSFESSANTDLTAAIALTGVAAVAGGLGLYLVLSAPSAPAATPAPQAILAPGAPGAPAGASLRVTF